jgi:hypothetical protein
MWPSKPGPSWREKWSCVLDAPSPQISKFDTYIFFL